MPESRASNPGVREETARLRRNPDGLNCNRQLLHLIPGGLALVAKFAAVERRKCHHDIRIGVHANHQIRLAVSHDHLTPIAALAKVRVVHGSFILHIQLTHKAIVSIRTCRRLVSRGTSGCGTVGALSTELPEECSPGRDSNPRPPALQAKYPRPTPPVKMDVMTLV